MQQYLDMVRYVLENSVKKTNRTGVSTLSSFAYFYKVDLSIGYPLLTTKKMYFNSMLHELLWYLSGEEHIKNLRTKTKIWDAWADKDGRLETAYGRFWRRYPVPLSGHLPGENWKTRWTYTDPATGTPVFDQIQFVIDTLKEIKINPETPNLRRMVVSAWHPGNAAESKLPPCHYTFCFNVSGKKLNCHLTQRSGDIALGIPFNLACYSLLTLMLAQECGYEPGEFAHTVIDAHIYENHVEGLREQLTRTPGPLPTAGIAKKSIFDLKFEDFELRDYHPQPKINFDVAV
ncbi:MAG: thymidylate synthase [Candidatus Marinimicrobia bacterium]|nr:thymidylate synthase [Candidatus Neomarinimicrobiota bacterium]